MDEESGTFLGYIYYYRGEQGIWTAFTRLETEDGFVLPMPERRRGSGRIIDPEGLYQPKPGETQEEYEARLIKEDDAPGWAYSDELRYVR